MFKLKFLIYRGKQMGSTGAIVEFYKEPAGMIGIVLLIIFVIFFIRWFLK